MKDDFIYFLKHARRGGLGLFTRDEKLRYLAWLDMLIENPPKLNKREVRIIGSYISRSIGLYLRLTGLCGKIGKITVRYDGCMENLIFMLEFMLHRYYYYIPREYLEKLYSKSLNVVRFCPFSQKELIEYEIDTGLVEKIHFYLEYYYSR